MAANGAVIFLLLAVVLAAVPAMVQSQTCKLQKFTSKAASAGFELCQDLPQLESQIHYTYNATNSSLSIAFVAAPSKTDGWISWALNPTARGMVGSQAFVAHISNGALVVKTLNISGYHEFNSGKLAFEFWDLSAEMTNGVNGSITIYASLSVPNNKTVVNQVWQVGPGVNTDGKIQQHDLSGESLKSTSSLSLTGGIAESPADSPTPGPTAGLTPPPSTSSSLSGGADLFLGLGFVAGLISLGLF